MFDGSTQTRIYSRRAAAEFLLIAMLLQPWEKELWRYLAGIARRKLHR
jgi:hypothetical protein